MKTRKTSRKPLTASGEYRDARNMLQRVTLHDLSEGGCRFTDTRGWLAKGDTLRITIGESGTHAAEICWRKASEVGLAFDRALTPAMLETIERDGDADANATQQEKLRRLI